MTARSGDELSAELYERAHSIATEVLHGNRFALASLCDEQRSQVESIVRTVATRLVQEPRAQLERLDAEAITDARIAALREVFGFDESYGMPQTARKQGRDAQRAKDRPSYPRTQWPKTPRSSSDSCP